MRVASIATSVLVQSNHAPQFRGTIYREIKVEIMWATQGFSARIAGDGCRFAMLPETLDAGETCRFAILPETLDVGEVYLFDMLPETLDLGEVHLFDMFAETLELLPEFLELLLVEESYRKNADCHAKTIRKGIL